MYNGGGSVPVNESRSKPETSYQGKNRKSPDNSITAKGAQIYHTNP